MGEDAECSEDVEEDVGIDVDAGDDLAESENGLRKLPCVAVFGDSSPPVFPSKSALETSTGGELGRDLVPTEVGGGDEVLAVR